MHFKCSSTCCHQAIFQPANHDFRGSDQPGTAQKEPTSTFKESSINFDSAEEPTTTAKAPITTSDGHTPTSLEPEPATTSEVPATTSEAVATTEAPQCNINLGTLSATKQGFLNNYDLFSSQWDDLNCGYYYWIVGTDTVTDNSHRVAIYQNDGPAGYITTSSTCGTFLFTSTSTSDPYLTSDGTAVLSTQGTWDGITPPYLTFYNADGTEMTTLQNWNYDPCS